MLFAILLFLLTTFQSFTYVSELISYIINLVLMKSLNRRNSKVYRSNRTIIKIMSLTVNNFQFTFSFSLFSLRFSLFNFLSYIFFTNNLNTIFVIYLNSMLTRKN